MIALDPGSSSVGERDLRRLSTQGPVHFMGGSGRRHVRAGRALCGERWNRVGV